MSNPIRFTPYAWAKLCFIRDLGDTEIGCFGMAETDDPLLLTDIFLPEQECTMTTVELDGQSLLDYRANCRLAGLSEKHSFRVWIHTHPNMSAKPSSTDETTYNELFGGADWGIMLIVSKTGDTYARVRYGGDGPQADAELAIVVDYSASFGESNHDDWEAIYYCAVTKRIYTPPANSGGKWVSNKAVTPASTTLATFPPAVGTGWQPRAEAEAEAEAETEAEAIESHVITVQSGREYDMRVMWCAACNREYEICDAIDQPDGIEADVCQFCSDRDVFEVHTYKIVV